MGKTLSLLVLSGLLTAGCSKDERINATINGYNVDLTTKGKATTLVLTKPNERITTYVDSNGDRKFDRLMDKNLRTGLAFEITTSEDVSAYDTSLINEGYYYWNEMEKLDDN